jgi:hypothetical protein
MISPQIRNFKRRYDEAKAQLATEHSVDYRAWLIRRVMEGHGSLHDRVNYRTPSCFYSGHSKPVSAGAQCADVHKHGSRMQISWRGPVLIRCDLAGWADSAEERGILGP